MSKKQSSIAITIITALTGFSVFGWLIIPLAVLNGIFIHEFLTMKGH